MRRAFSIGLVLALFLASWLASAAQAWSFKEHLLVTRLAVQRLLADPDTPRT